jgi:hypothetical protein
MTCPDLLCRTGDLLLPMSVRKVLERYWIGDDTSLVYVTNWTFVHFFSGILLVRLFPTLSAWGAFWIHTAAELWQILIRNTPWQTARGRMDVFVDTLVFMSGVWIAKA